MYTLSCIKIIFSMVLIPALLGTPWQEGLLVLTYLCSEQRAWFMLPNEWMHVKVQCRCSVIVCWIALIEALTEPAPSRSPLLNVIPAMMNHGFWKTIFKINIHCLWTEQVPLEVLWILLSNLLISAIKLYECRRGKEEKIKGKSS